jgi:hypothetical protein
MTKLEEEITKAIIEPLWSDVINQDAIAKAAAEVAKKWIENAFDYGKFSGNAMAQTISGQKALTKEDWLKENGITE